MVFKPQFCYMLLELLLLQPLSASLAFHFDE